MRVFIAELAIVSFLTKVRFLYPQCIETTFNFIQEIMKKQAKNYN